MVVATTLDGRLRKIGGVLTSPFVAVLRVSGVSPNVITIAGAFIAISAGIAFGQGWFALATAILLVGGFADMLDGAYARATGTASVFGAFLDATLDRISDMALYLGLAAYYAMHGLPLGAWLALLSLITAATTSYAKARAEALDIPCAIGWMSRAPRILLLLLGAILGPRWMVAALAITTLLGIETVVRRMYRVYRSTKGMIVG